MSRYQDGEYIHLYFSDDPCWRLFKGWHEVEHCQAGLVKFEGEEYAPRVVRVQHTYGFWGVGLDEMGERGQMFYPRDEPGRGRFKVTLAHVEWPDRDKNEYRGEWRG